MKYWAFFPVKIYNEMELYLLYAKDDPFKQSFFDAMKRMANGGGDDRISGTSI